MLLDSANMQTETNCNVQGHTFSIKASPVAFDILSSKLYSNPILAIVRELLTNAYDSHKAAGKEDVPIKVNLPSYLEPNFIIRDYGLGLSKEDVMEMYTTFFSSTKSDSNDFTGCFGLGSKTPFSYTTSFSVNSYWNGTKYYFIATKKDGLPNIFFVKEESTEEENGLEISIPTDKSGGFDHKFHNEMVNYLKYIPEIKVDTPKEIVRRVPLISKDVFKLYEKEIPSYSWDRSHATSICYIKQGQNIYKVNDFIDKYGQGAKEAGEIDLSTLRYFFNYCDIVIEVPIGTLSITPSRESLSQEEENIAKVEEQILKINDYLKLCLIEDIGLFNIAGSNLNRLYNELMTEKFFGKEHPFEAKITQRNSYANDDEVGCKLHKCYLHSVDYSGLNKNVLITQNKKSIVLLVPSTFNHAGIQKLKNTINNYDELDEVNIYIVMTYGSRLHYDSSFLTFARNVKKTIQTLNSMEEYNFDVELQTINSFYRRYTNHKKQRDTSYDPTEKCIRYKYASIAPKGRSDSSGYGTDSIEYIKERYKEENTIVIFKEAPKTYNYTSEKASVVHYFLQNIKDKEGNNFVYEYLKELLPNLDNLQMVHFLEISKTAKKYFKEYEITSFDRIFEFIQEADWLIATPVEETLLEFVTEFDDMFKANFKSKAYDFISRTKSYYKLTRLKAMAENNTTVRNTLDGYALNNLQKYLPKMVNKKVYSSFSKNILSDKLRKLFNIFDCSRKRHKSHWSRKRNEWEDGNTHFRLLSKTYRLEVLGLLKGDL